MPVSPLTDSEDVTLISVMQSSKLINEWKRQFQIDITTELSRSEEIYLYQCNQTKLFFFAPSNISGSGWLYEQLQKFDWFYMPHKWEHQIALQDLKDCRKVIEVGCAFGAFVELGLKAGLNIQGIELNEAAVTVAQSRNLPVRNMNLKDFADSHPESLDALCSFQVLEHIPNPKDFLEWSIRSLKVGGKLIICVPNSESFLKHQYNLLDMPPHHMLKWTKSAFCSLEKLFPIKLEKAVREPLASYHVSGYLGSYSSYFRTHNPLSALLFNRHTLRLYERLLQLGLRKYLTGQSLYVQFRKLL
jgi:2-polyprenyl-3-methyl-5-hydroxy-6-metoxy-1,4-benzoquinol methylase